MNSPFHCLSNSLVSYHLTIKVLWSEIVAKSLDKETKKYPNLFLVNETNRRTELKFCWYYDSTCFGQPFCPSSGVLRRTSVLVHFCSCDHRLLPGAGCSWQQTVITTANMYQYRCRLRTPYDGQKGCPKHVES